MVEGCGCDMKGQLMHYVEESEAHEPREQAGAWTPYNTKLFRCGQSDQYKEPDGTIGIVTRLCSRCMKELGFLW